MNPRQCFINAARGYLWTPFRHQGRGRGGVDCIGLLVCAARDAGIPIQDRTEYSEHPDGESLIRELRTQLCEIPPIVSLPGDVLAFRMTRLGPPRHVGILTTLYDGGLGLLHTYQSVGHVAEHHFTDRWKSRIVSAFRFPGLS